MDNYDEKNIEKIINIYKGLEQCFKEQGYNPSKTLITKIMLGVFGNVCAFDSYFCETFKNLYKDHKDPKLKCSFASFSQKALLCIRDFYNSYEDVINQYALSQKTRIFNYDNDFLYNYPKTKIIDMFGFQYGLMRDKKEKSSLG
ncbi:hypothetical protein [Helicobacter cetorum]|uniref:Uncharacterized protein n=1 Tax=Helicobacter cetorum (strain ATCC BAA-540 / CCUG 52418 / MIT 99-5656) TaxID=1163745 RepID=I0ETD5_HELCM|nr:hypothetical protein [Helicobacter cetorum]AFI06204.1 hypothetical protein HCD_06010 [Helicobacter cetorum MIT 99-5656]